VRGAELVDVVDRLVHAVHQLQRERQAAVLVARRRRVGQPQRAGRLLAAVQRDVCGAEILT
jgi:hypothetical protein